MNLWTQLIPKAVKQRIVQEELTGSYNQNVYRWLNDGQPIFLNDNAESYITDGYLSNSAVYECISLLLEKVVSCPRLFYEIKTGKEQKAKEYQSNFYSSSIEAKQKALAMKAEVLEETTVKEIQAILDKPNVMQDMNEIIQNLAGSYLLLGNAYLYKNGPDVENEKWSEIFVLPANRMHIISGGMFNPVKGYCMDYNTDNENPFPSKQVDHIKTFNPLSNITGYQLYGVPPLRPYLNQLLNEKLGSKEIAKQLKNGGTFGVLSPKDKMDQFTAEHRKEFKERLVEAKRSGDEISRIFPGSIALDWTQIGLPIGDLQLMDILKVGREDIYKAYKIPFSFANQDTSTYDNVNTDNKRLVYNAIAPICRKISDLLTKALCEPVSRRTGKKYIIMLDYNSLPEMAADMGKIAEWLDKCWDLTPNQKLEAKGWGRSSQPGMDTVWVPSGLRPIEDAVISEQEFNQANQGATEL